MKEEEAKTKECPQHMIMMVILQAAAINNKAPDEVIDKVAETGYCSGSNCMMWVWDDKQNDSIGEPTIKVGHCGLTK